MSGGVISHTAPPLPRASSFPPSSFCPALLFTPRPPRTSSFPRPSSSRPALFFTPCPFSHAPPSPSRPALLLAPRPFSRWHPRHQPSDPPRAAGGGGSEHREALPWWVGRRGGVAARAAASGRSGSWRVPGSRRCGRRPHGWEDGRRPRGQGWVVPRRIWEQLLLLLEPSMALCFHVVPAQ